jgi:hypothetical protein
MFLLPFAPRWREPYWFFNGVGATLMALVASDTPSVQAIFSCELARYLGRISFALYLVHGTCIHVVALWLIPTMWQLTGNDTTLKFELGFFLATSIHVPITFFAADLFTKTFDDTAVRFAKWVEGKVNIVEAEKCNQYQPLDELSLPLVELVFSSNKVPLLITNIGSSNHLKLPKEGQVLNSSRIDFLIINLVLKRNQCFFFFDVNMSRYAVMFSFFN